MLGLPHRFRTIAQRWSPTLFDEDEEPMLFAGAAVLLLYAMYPVVWYWLTH